MGKEKIRALIVKDPQGDLYARTINELEDYFVPTDFSMGAFAGDVVMMHVKSATRKNDLRPTTRSGVEKPQYAVVDSIEEYSDFYYSGVCFENGEEMTFVPDDREMDEYNVFKTKRGGAVDGERVVAQISRKKFSREYKAGVEQIYGNGEDVVPYIVAAEDSVLRNLGWNDDEKMSESDLGPSSSARRKDLRTKVSVAITDDHSPSDRAFSMERVGDDYVLSMHLLDVDEFVGVGSKLDKIVEKRLRFPDAFDKKRPLFSERVTSSLEFVEGEDRNAVTITAIYSADIKLKTLYIDNTIINLTMKATYDEIDYALKESDSSKTKQLRERMVDVKELANLIFSFAGQVIANTSVQDGFVGTCLAPRFVVEHGKVVELSEKTLKDGELLEKCLLTAMSNALGEYSAKNDIPMLYEGEWELFDSDWDYLSSYCRGPLTPENVYRALSSLYNNCERGVYERSAYNVIYSRLIETFISEKPVKNTLKGTCSAAVVDGPLTNYVGLTLVRLLKSVINGNEKEGSAIAKKVALQYSAVMPLVYKTCRALYYRTMFAFAALLPTPAEAIITSIRDGKAVVTLVNGCVGYIYQNVNKGVLIDGGEKAIAIRDKKYTYGDYVTVRFGDADPEKCEVIYEPIG